MCIGVRVTWAGRTLHTATADFGTKEPGLKLGDAQIVLAEPLDGSTKLPTMIADGKVVLVKRGGVPFVEKVTNVQAAGAIAVIIFDNQDGRGPMQLLGEDPYMTKPCGEAISRADFDVGKPVMILSPSKIWRACTVTTINDDTEDPSLKVHYDGFDAEHDEWLQIGRDVTRIRLPCTVPDIRVPVVSISKADGTQLAAAIKAGRTTISLQGTFSFSQVVACY